ncbi:hypothetical protein [Planctomyces sp. SH-PL62]|uniref:hypothetical protein n=1 Tax=Planctomyces sp. SH-PL62 TaxID=1636152 RepID=UPI00078E47FF|nr:hypothetical protein [Planctomyces sp. SH-PL62]AMV39722.1 hypothetical protein VT85_19980 [Planctomyces sp. SH-PL62]
MNRAAIRHPVPPTRSRTIPVGPAFAFALVLAVAAVVVAPPPRAFASDHADPIDPFNRERLEGGITDLFVFPVLADGSPAFPFERTDDVSLAKPDLKPRRALSDEERSQIKNLIVILCVRRALTETGKLRLEPYTYRVHIDKHTSIDFDDTPGDAPTPTAAGEGYMFSESASKPKVSRPTGAEARLRYGGRIPVSNTIEDDVLVEFKLKNDASLREFRVVKGLLNASDKDVRLVEDLEDLKVDPDRITAWAGVRDDPFIFPAFFQTNVIAMVMSIPMSAFKEGTKDWIVWGTSHSGSRQIDHVGRSLRTQNPRFELLNTLPPREHVEAIIEEHEHPSLARDIALRFNFQSMFAYRRWDFVPDVMVFTTRFPVGFPNGRLLTDDVAPLLAQHGDTLLLELSHHVGGWPRATTNDKDFLKTFPYLAAPWPDRAPTPPPTLNPWNKAKLVGIVVGLVALLALENWAVAYFYHRRKLRRRYVL